jgi:hypothetical protein
MEDSIHHSVFYGKSIFAVYILFSSGVPVCNPLRARRASAEALLLDEVVYIDA